MIVPRDYPTPLRGAINRTFCALRRQGNLLTGNAQEMCNRVILRSARANTSKGLVTLV